MKKSIDLKNPEILNNLVLGLAALLQRDFDLDEKDIEFEFDRLGHPGDHNEAAVLLLLELINGCKDAAAEAYQDKQQLFRESEARI